MALPRIAPYSYDARTALTSNTTSWACDPVRAVLLVHDMQEHFLRAFESGDGQVAVAIANIDTLIQTARRSCVPVVYTAQPPLQDPTDRALLSDFWGPGLRDADAAEIVDRLAPHPGDTVLTKWRYSAFHRSDLRDRMRNAGRDQLIVTGVYAHIGCLTTSLVAFMEDIRPFFAADAMADFSRGEHEMAAHYVARRCGQIVTTEDVLGSLDHAITTAQPV